MAVEPFPTEFPGYKLSCPSCREGYVAVGLTDAVASRAANAGPTCCPPLELTPFRGWASYSRADKITLVVGSLVLAVAAAILLLMWGVLPL